VRCSALPILDPLLKHSGVFFEVLVMRVDFKRGIGIFKWK